MATEERSSCSKRMGWKREGWKTSGRIKWFVSTLMVVEGSIWEPCRSVSAVRLSLSCLHGQWNWLNVLPTHNCWLFSPSSSAKMNLCTGKHNIFPFFLLLFTLHLILHKSSQVTSSAAKCRNMGKSKDIYLSEAGEQNLGSVSLSEIVATPGAVESVLCPTPALLVPS